MLVKLDKHSVSELSSVYVTIWYIYTCILQPLVCYAVCMFGDAGGNRFICRINDSDFQGVR